jgi:two-component system, OmpR family, sensor kinase
VSTRSGPRFPSPLILRIYALGIAQFALVAFGMFVIVKQHTPSPPSHSREVARILARALEPKLADPAALAAELKRLDQGPGWAVAVYDANHRLIASTRRPPGKPGPDVPGFGRPRSTPLTLADGQPGTMVLLLPRPPAPPPGPWVLIGLVLVVVGITSWLSARSLAQPLAALAGAAKAFGAGQLTARAPLQRRDELGDVARAFNEMAQRISHLLRAEKELIANVSHELRTPLARMQVALDLAAEGDGESARESLGEIAEDLAELERIVGDVLTAARLSLSQGLTASHATPPVRMEEVEVESLLERASARFRSAHPSRTLLLQLMEANTLIRADAVLFRRVLDNLLDNAAKYSEESGGPVELAAERSGEHIVFEVRDDGIGIAPDDLARVFEPFFRADRSRTRSTGGYGLGLALARRIVEAHAGTLALRARPGGGTVARVELPLASGT